MDGQLALMVRLCALGFGLRTVTCVSQSGRPKGLVTGCKGVRRMLIMALLVSVAGSPASHGNCLMFWDQIDQRRAVARGSGELPKGRLVLGQTRDYCDKLLEYFRDWLGKR